MSDLLITTDDEKLALMYKRLKAIRSREDLKLKPLKHLKETFTGYDGIEYPLELRYYQIQGILHLVAMNRFVLGDSCGLGKCVTGDTLVKTAKGLVPIQNLNPGITEPDTFVPVEHESIVVGVDERRIVNFYYGGVKPTRRLVTYHGYEIEGSLVHPVLVRRKDGEKWVKLSDVKEGDYLCVERQQYGFSQSPVNLPTVVCQNGEKKYRHPCQMTPDLARFLGYTVGEGWFNHAQKYAMTISQSSEINPAVSIDIENLLDLLFEYPVYKKGNDYRISSTYIIRWLEEIGVSRGVAKDKEIPWSVLQSGRENVQHFVRALVDSESFVSKDGIEFTSASEKLVKQLQIVLLGFGVVSRRTPKKVKGYDHTYWRLTILGEDARCYMEHIGLISPRKISAIEPLMGKRNNPNHDLVPYLKHEVEALRSEVYSLCSRHGYKGGGIVRSLGSFVYGALSEIRTGRRDASYPFLHAFIKTAEDLGVNHSGSIQPLRSILDKQWFYDPVVSIENKEKEVFDIEVDDPDHCFVGNGVVNHNTIQSIGALCCLWEKEPDMKVIVLTVMSAVEQWAEEFNRFTTGVRTIIPRNSTGGEKRKPGDPRWSVGDFIEIDASKHIPSKRAKKSKEETAWYTKTAGVYKKYNAEIGVVREVEEDDIIVEFINRDSKLVRIPGAQRFRGVGIKTYTGPEIRKSFYREFEKSTGPTVLIMNYAKAVIDISELQHWSGYALIADECFHYHTPIVLADGSTELIGKIVSQKMDVDVLSWNSRTGQIEPKRIVNWYRNPLVRGRRKNLLKLKFKMGGNVRVTREHEFYAPGGNKLSAKNLKVGSPVFHLCGDTPSRVQRQVVLGGLMGDASLSHPDRHQPGVSFVQSEKQEEYLKFKRQILEPLGVSDITTQPSGYKKTAKIVRFRLNKNAALTSFFDKSGIWHGGKKTLTTEWLDALDPFGMAIWYADDGSIQSHVAVNGEIRISISLHTCGFTRHEHELLAGWLRWKWGIAAEIKKSKSYFHLYLKHDAAVAFLDLLPGAIPGMEYKFPGKDLICLEDLDLEPQTSLVEDEVVAKEVWEPVGSSSKYVYDIEVEENHNYFANRQLVSNCTAFKNPRTETWKVCNHLSKQARRTYGLTATLIKGKLEDGYGIYNVIVPGLFGSYKNFLDNYCVYQMQPIPGSRRKVPVVVGYRKKHVKAFREHIDPFYLGRAKSEVAKELPSLITREIRVALDESQEDLYAEALSGLLEIGEGDDSEMREVTKLTAITYCQQIVNHPALIKRKGRSNKLNKLVELITEGEFADEKIIVFSRLKQMVFLAQRVLEKKGVKSVRVTGDEDDLQREEAKKIFQNPKSGVNVIFITMAGSHAINLQSAMVTVFYDTPFTAGDYIQLLGRKIRIGSIHSMVYAIHLIAKDTVDERVMQILRGRLTLFEAVVGKRIKEADDPTGEDVIETGNEVNDLFEALQSDARRIT